VERHARAWLWYLVACFLLPDGSGNTVTSLVLPILSQDWEDIAGYSWASATLAHLYRQLCEGCRRTEASSNVAGCMYLLMVWSWERLPIGRAARGEVPVQF
jgi:hypothetical protein